MSLLKPFRGVRPPKSKALEVAAPPYDVVNSAEARAMAKGKPDSFFRISRPEVDLPRGTDEHADIVYRRGAENLRDFIGSGVLRADDHPHFYAYRQQMGAHVQTGLVAAASVDEYDRGLIKKHELTRADKEDDRTRHIAELEGNDEPVFLTYRARAEIDALIVKATSGEAEYDFTSDDGIRHTFWVIDEAQSGAIGEAFTSVPALYIADGHHRSAAASRVAKLRAGKSGEHDFFLAVVFPDAQLQILPYHRLVKDLRGIKPWSLLGRIGERFTITSDAKPTPTKPHTFGLYLGGRWLQLQAKPGTWKKTAVGELDVSILQTNLLQPIFGVKEPRTDPNLDFVGGIRGTPELERRVDSGSAALAISMYPTGVEQMIAIADAGEIMPPKSTWFEPKLRSGLVLHLFSP